jgi:hypothetical protein
LEDYARSDTGVEIEVYAPSSDKLAAELREVERGEPITTFRSRYLRIGQIARPIEFQKDWQTGQAAAVSRCDAVIIVGGKEGSANILALATAMEKPVIGVADFGGVGQRYFQDYIRPRLNKSGLNKDQIRAMEYWSSTSAAAYVTFAEKIRRRERRKSLLPAYSCVIVFAIILCWSWWHLCETGFTGERWPKLLLVAASAGLLGWILSFVYNLQDFLVPEAEEKKRPSLRRPSGK